MRHTKPGAAQICTAQRSGGDFCHEPSLPDAPFPICLKHAAKVMAYLNDFVPSDLGSRMIVAARAVDQDRARRKPEAQGVVYYLRVGDLIKIGHTIRLTYRLSQYPPDSVLLATEPGTRSLEAQRHREFVAELKRRNEWFEPSPRLLAHIASLKQRAA